MSGSLPAIDFLSPLPPEESGVADYAAGLLPHLARVLEVRAFTRDPRRSASAALGSIELCAYGDFRPAAGRIAVHQIGNHAGHHGAIFRIALRHPGIAVVHEHVLHDLVRDCALEDGGPRAYAEELRYALGRTGERLAARLRAGGERLSPFDWPLFERVVDASLVVLVHSRAARDRIARSRPLARVRVVPQPVTDPGDCTERAAELRRELEIPSDALVLGAFGIAAETKRLDLVLRAFARLAARRNDVILLLVGPESPRFASGLGGTGRLASDLERRLRALDRVPLARLETAMAATDLAFNLRHPTGGETSGACLRLLAHGRPVVVSDAGWFAEIPDSACVKVRPDALEEPMLHALVGALAERPALRRAIGAGARRWVLEQHSYAAAVAGYAAAVEEAKQVRREPSPRPAGVPHSDDVDAELLLETAAALGDLGVTEADGDVLEELARLAAEIGITGAGARAADARRGGVASGRR